MKNTIKALKFSIVFFLLVSFFLACDKDFAIIESDVLGEGNSNFDADNEFLQISAYNKKLDSLQINGLASNLLGAYNDPIYGQTTASIITQIVPTISSPDFGINPVIDSVVLNIPYYSRITGTDSDGNSTYTILDSLYGESSTGSVNPFKLTIYQNNYFLRDFDPSSTLDQRQNYYSKSDVATNGTDNFVLNGSSLINFDNHKGAIIKDEIFTPTSNPTKTSVITNDVKVTTQSAPAFRVKLDSLFWTKAIIEKAGNAVLSSASNFKNYFRGLYFKAEAIGGEGSMILLNIANAGITIYYSKDSTVGNEKIQDTYVLNFTSSTVTVNTLNTFINNYSTVTLQNGNKTTGDEKLYLKGTAGSMAVVDLFSGLVDCDGDGLVNDNALDCFKNTYRKLDENGSYIKNETTGNYIIKRLINDAQLIVYEDETLVTGANTDYHKYDRLYAYDIKNNTPLVDYTYDATNNAKINGNPFNSTYFHLGQRLAETSGKFKYKIHLTEHLNNILLRDSTNTKIGLVLSTNVNYNNNAAILKSADNVKKIPAAAIITPRGTVLHGANSNNPETKMKLQVFFTEPK